MAKDKEIAYSTVKDIDIASAIKGSTLTAVHSRKADKASKDVWGQTVCTVMENTVLVNSLHEKAEDNAYEKNLSLIQGALEQAILAVITVPDTGKDRKGNTISLRKSDGTVKWSSWEDTAVIWKYTSDISKVLTAGLGDTLYPDKGKVAARCDILAQIEKAISSPLDNIVRLAKDMQGWANKIEPAESEQAAAQVDAIVVSHLTPLSEALSAIQKLDRICGAVIGTEDGEAIRKALLAMATRHFK